MSLSRSLDEFYRWKYPQQASRSREFAAFFVEAMSEINKHSTTPITIITTSFNARDGIGDFVNQVDFTEWLWNILNAYENIQISSISILEQKKFALATRLMPEHARATPSVVVRRTENFPLGHVSSRSETILCDYNIDLNHPFLREKLAQADCIINVARFFWVEPSLCTLLSLIPRRCFTVSRGEYGPLGRKDGTNEAKIYYENCMGVRATETGIKIYSALAQRCAATQTLERKAQLLRNFDNTLLTKSLLNGESAVAYLNNHGFAFGYIQDKVYAIVFARLMIAKSADKQAGITLVVDLTHFSTLVQEERLLKQLIESGYSNVKTINNDGTVKSEITLDSAIGNKTLTLVEFRGTSPHDKDYMIAMSDMVAGSGNSSFSEMISSRRFPFIQPIRHVMHFYIAFIDAIKAIDHPSAQALVAYLTLNIKLLLSEEDIATLMAMTQGRQYEEIMDAWRSYCAFLERERNAYHDMVEIITTFIVSKLLELGNAKPDKLLCDIDHLLAWFPEGKVGDTTLLHVAIEKKLDNVVCALLSDSNLAKHHLINATCLFRNYTPLMLAARYQQYDHVAWLLTNNASISACDNEGLTVAHQAVINRDTPLLRLLANHHPEVASLIDAAGKTPLICAIEIGDIAMIALLLSLDTKQTWKKSKIPGVDLTVIEYAANLLEPRDLHLFGISQSESDIISVAQYAVAKNSPALFAKCCQAVNDSHGKEKLALQAMAISSNLHFAREYIHAFNDPIPFEIFCAHYIPPLLKTIPANQFGIHHLSMIDLTKLEIELIHAITMLSPALSPHGTAIDERLINQLVPIMKRLLKTSYPTDRPEHEKITRQLYLEFAEFYLNSTKSVNDDSPAYRKLQFMVLKNRIIDYLHHAQLMEKTFSITRLFQRTATATTTITQILASVAATHSVADLQHLLNKHEALPIIKQMQQDLCNKLLPARGRSC